MPKFDKPKQKKIVFKEGPGIMSGRPVHLGGRFANLSLSIYPGEVLELEASLADQLVAEVYQFDYVDPKDAPPKKESDLPPNQGGCKSCQ
jgi:hypothetical protein